MKVLDIIQESRADEFINAILKGVAWSVGRGPRAVAAEELATVWARKMVERGSINVPMPINVIRDPVLAADREIIDAAYKEAVKAFRKAERAGLIQDIKAGAAAAKENVGTLIRWSKNLFITAAYIGSMFHAGSLVSEYNKTAEEFERDLQSGDMNEAEFRSSMGALRLRLISELALVMGSTLAAGITTGAAVLSAKLGNLMIRFITFNKWKDALGPLVSLYSTASAGVQYYFVYQLSVNKVAREQLMDLILSDNIVMKNVVAAAYDPANHPFIKWATSIFKEAEDKQSTQPSSSGPSEAPAPRPRPAGKEEPTGIDWGKQQ